MHTNVHCSTVYNSKDMGATQMPIDDGLDWENVAHIHHGILRSHKKWWLCVLHRACMNLETIILSKLTQEQKTKHCTLSLRRVLNNEKTWTQGGEHHIMWPVSGARGGTLGVGERDNEGRNTRYRWWGDGGSKPPCHVCTYATILHDLHMLLRT